MNLHLLPVPRQVTPGEGTYTLSPYAKIVLPHTRSAMLSTAAGQLQEEVRLSCGMPLGIIAGAAREGDVALRTDPAMDAQSYTLELSPAGVTVCGGSEAGVLHGVQTLRQLLRQFGPELPALMIHDAPCYPARGYYYDVSRGRTPTMDYLKQLADEACFYKLNQLQLYVEHTYLFRDLSEMWLAGEPLSAEDIMELDDYCAARGIELVPSLSTFGHLLELLRTKSYCELCELYDADKMPSTMLNRMFHHTLNVADPRSFELVRAMIAEFMPLFRSRLFNICADETFDLGKGRTRELMAEVGERQLYIGFVKKLCDFVVSQGRTPMFWGDIVAKFPEALTVLPQSTLCLNWGYSAEVKEDVTRSLAENGATQYVCPGVNGWDQMVNRLHYSYENIRRMAAYGKKYGAVGLLNTDWGDHGHLNDPRFSLPGLIYGATLSWSQETPAFEEMNESISRLAYRDSSGKIVSLMAEMENCEIYRWHGIVWEMDYALGLAQFEEPPLIATRNHARFQSVAEANRTLERVEQALRKCATALDTSTRPMVYRLSLAAEGIRLWNLVGEAVTEGRKDAALAAQLENWYHLYEALWRQTSRESELWRTKNVVRWYASENLR